MNTSTQQKTVNQQPHGRVARKPRSRPTTKAKPSTAGASTSSRKHRSIRAAKTNGSSADVKESRSSPRTKPITIPAGTLPSSRKRRSTEMSKAIAPTADVKESQSIIETKTKGKPTGTPSHTRTQHRSTQFPKANHGPADVVREQRSTGPTKAFGMTAAAPPLPDLRFADPQIATLRSLWQRRQSWHRAEKSLTLTASAICRRQVGVNGKEDKSGLKLAKELLDRIESGTEDGDAALAVLPLIAARAQIEPKREAVEKALATLTKQLPIAHVLETPGIGPVSLYSIVGEAGDLSAYRSTRGLWKRLGLAVIDGKRQRKCTDAIDAKEHGYSPSRRSVVWNVGNNLIGGMGRGPRPKLNEVLPREGLSEWQNLFMQRLRFEAERDPEHRRPDVVKDDVVYESYSKHAFNRSKRYVEKLFVKHLRQAWRNKQ